MRIHPHYFHYKSTKIFSGILFCFLGMIMLAGCTGKYGRLKRSAEITDIFETNQIMPGHRYYYSGFAAVPYAIVAIHTDYSLKSPAWKKMSPTPEILGKLVFRMQSAYRPFPLGAWIVGPDEQRLGIWYSSERHTAVRIAQGNQIKLAPPEPAELRGIP